MLGVQAGGNRPLGRLGDAVIVATLVSGSGLAVVAVLAGLFGVGLFIVAGRALRRAAGRAAIALGLAAGRALGIVFGRLFLGLCFALLQQLLDQCLVIQRRLEIRLALEGLLIGIQGGFQLAAAGQGIASIVVGRCRIALGKGLGGRGVVAGLVQRHAAPLRVLEVPGGLRRAVLFKQALALLVGAQPQVIELEGLAGLGQGQQQRKAEKPAAPTRAGGQQ
ncbi:hypothetical protein D3C81_1094660 [compost metagenome]